MQAQVSASRQTNQPVNHIATSTGRRFVTGHGILFRSGRYRFVRAMRVAMITGRFAGRNFGTQRQAN
jgi:hypothetical protein